MSECLFYKFYPHRKQLPSCTGVMGGRKDGGGGRTAIFCRYCSYRAVQFRRRGDYGILHPDNPYNHPVEKKEIIKEPTPVKQPKIKTQDIRFKEPKVPWKFRDTSLRTLIEISNPNKFVQAVNRALRG